MKSKNARNESSLRPRNCVRRIVSVCVFLARTGFFNRYWLLEGNGMPYDNVHGGDANYASARYGSGALVEDAAYFLAGAGVDLDEIRMGGFPLLIPRW